MSGNIKLKDQIYENILNEIIDGNYRQNDIITERELIEKYGVSKSPIREALVELCNEKILESRPRMGYQICPISIKEISDIVELRIILETAALEKTFAHMESRQIEQLKQEVLEATKIHSEKKIAKYWKSNISFHILLCSFCGNEKICEAVERALKFSSRSAVQYYFSSSVHRNETKAQRHILLIEALEKGLLEEAKEVLKDDIMDLKREIVEGIIA